MIVAIAFERAVSTIRSRCDPDTCFEPEGKYLTAYSSSPDRVAGSVACLASVVTSCRTVTCPSARATRIFSNTYLVVTTPQIPTRTKSANQSHKVIERRGNLILVRCLLFWPLKRAIEPTLPRGFLRPILAVVKDQVVSGRRRHILDAILHVLISSLSA